MQAEVRVGVCLSRTRRPPRTLLQLRLGQQGGGGCSLTDCMQAAEEDKRPCRGGQNRTEESGEHLALVVTTASCVLKSGREMWPGPLRDRLCGVAGCGIWDARVWSHAHRTGVHGARRAPCSTPQLCPGPPDPHLPSQRWWASSAEAPAV